MTTGDINKQMAPQTSDVTTGSTGTSRNPAFSGMGTKSPRDSGYRTASWLNDASQMGEQFATWKNGDPSGRDITPSMDPKKLPQAAGSMGGQMALGAGAVGPNSGGFNLGKMFSGMFKGF
jgi:hypothetical protein